MNTQIETKEEEGLLPPFIIPFSQGNGEEEKEEEEEVAEYFVVNLSVGTKESGLWIKKYCEFFTIEEAWKFYNSIDLETDDYMSKEIECITYPIDDPTNKQYEIVDCEYHKDWEKEDIECRI